MNRERLPLVWWLAAIPMVAIAASSYVFALICFWLWGTAAWVWFGAPSSSPRRKVTVNVMTIVIYGIGLALPLPGLGPATPERLLVAFGITAVLLIAHFVYLAAKLTKYVPDTSGSSLFTDRGRSLGLNFKHKLALWYLLWLVLPLPIGWLLFKLRQLP